MEGWSVQLNDDSMHHCTAAINVSRGIPSIVRSMNDLAVSYNQVFQEGENELRSLEKILTSIRSNTVRTNTKLLELFFIRIMGSWVTVILIIIWIQP